MFEKLFPRQDDFFNYLEKQATFVKSACDTLGSLVRSGASDREAVAARLKDIERQADEVTHECLAELSERFTAPIDGADIHVLIQSLDDVIDAVEAAASRLTLYGLTTERAELRQAAAILSRAGSDIESAVQALPQPKNHSAAKGNLDDIHELERQGDALLRTALSTLFENETDAILVIKWKDVFERLEKAIDRCATVANVIEKIMIEAS